MAHAAATFAVAFVQRLHCGRFLGVADTVETDSRHACQIGGLHPARGKVVLGLVHLGGSRGLVAGSLDRIASLVRVLGTRGIDAGDDLA